MSCLLLLLFVIVCYCYCLSGNALNTVANFFSQLVTLNQPGLQFQDMFQVHECCCCCCYCCVVVVVQMLVKLVEVTEDTPTLHRQVRARTIIVSCDLSHTHLSNSNRLITVYHVALLECVQRLTHFQ